MTTKERPHCPHCGSADVVADGPAKWVVSAQRWKLLQAVYDGGTCTACESEIRTFDWRPVARRREKAE